MIAMTPLWPVKPLVDAACKVAWLSALKMVTLPDHDPFTNVLEVLVRRLRRKIDDEFPTKLIQTVRGAGYRFGD